MCLGEGGEKCAAQDSARNDEGYKNDSLLSKERASTCQPLHCYQEFKEFKVRFNYQKQAVKSTMYGVSKDQDEGPWPELSAA